MVKLRLVGSNRYTIKGEMYEHGRDYTVSPELAQELLSQRDPHTGMPYFEESGRPAPATPGQARRAQKKVSASQAAAQPEPAGVVVGG